MAQRGTPIPNATLLLMRRLRDQGWSRRSIARALHISRTTVWRYLTAYPRRDRLAA